MTAASSRSSAATILTSCSRPLTAGAGSTLTLLISSTLLLIALSTSPLPARDLYALPDLPEYYESLRMPDQPTMSCCGIGDSYYADKTEIDQLTGDLIAIITDTRPDSFTLPDGRTINRVHIPEGTRFIVPKHKIRKYPIPNPTGHTIVFIGAQMNVLCYEPLPLG